MITIPAIISTNTAITNEIQIGANTHNQDHAIQPVSFNVINKIANNPGNPIPELDVDLLSDISLNLKFVAGMGFEPTYDQGYEPCELPVLYPTKWQAT